MKLRNTTIDVKSFFKKGIKSVNDNFGIMLITGYQGSGKTWLSLYLLSRADPSKPIYTNIKSLKIPNRKIHYFEKITEITSNIETNTIFLIDEISKKYTKECKQDQLFYSWLQQSRKRQRTVLLITQEYLQCPIWLRGVARYVYTTKKLPFGIFMTYKGIAVLNEDKEWTVDPLERYIYKRTKDISLYYDTFEPVNTL